MGTIGYICPVCGNELERVQNSYVCPKRHSFDIARKGYVNLLTTSGRDPSKAGDDADMVRARTDFLDIGHYERLADAVADTVGRWSSSGSAVIDSGCGEGYYTVRYAQQLTDREIYGIDISKRAVAHCMTRAHAAGASNCEFAVASSYALPFPDHCADVIVSTFAPVVDKEYARVIKEGGALVVVSPSPRHLYELKAELYEHPYENSPNSYGLDSFTEADSQTVEYTSELRSQKEIADLFMMTPYYYKTPKEGIERLKKLDRLALTCGFVIQVFTRK
ncbi:MAG: methyltransferase domain-containing protein [Oscillospiraceae bacterium]|nr:methyltransferase domain-containing protein [Oscillospiraceae bacterium]